MTAPSGVTRCRGPFLYTPKGRWLDLDRAGGRALFGWNDPKIMSRYRNELARGLTGPYSSFWPNRLTRLVQRLYPGATPRPLKPLETLPAIRPFQPIPELPCALVLPDLLLGVSIVLEQESPLPSAWEGLPAVSIAASCAAAGALESRHSEMPEHWKSWEHPVFERTGPWLIYQGSAEDYAALREELLTQKIFLPQTPETPTCLPWNPVPAEAKRWKMALKSFLR